MEEPRLALLGLADRDRTCAGEQLAVMILAENANPIAGIDEKDDGRAIRAALNSSTNGLKRAHGAADSPCAGATSDARARQDSH